MLFDIDTNKSKQFFLLFTFAIWRKIWILFEMTNWRRVRIWFYLKDRKTFSVAKKVLLTTWHVKSLQKVPNFLRPKSFSFQKIAKILNFIFSEIKSISMSKLFKSIETCDFPWRFSDSQQSGNADTKRKKKSVIISCDVSPSKLFRGKVARLLTNFSACSKTTKIKQLFFLFLSCLLCRSRSTYRIFESLKIPEIQQFELISKSPSETSDCQLEFWPFFLLITADDGT